MGVEGVENVADAVRPVRLVSFGVPTMSIVKSLSFHGTRVITMQAVTIPALKTGNPFGGTTKTHNLRKYATVAVLAGGDYQWLVNISRVLEGSPANPQTGEVEQFVALPANWGTYMVRPDGSRMPIVEHTPKTGPNAGSRTEYLPVSVIRSVSYEYRQIVSNPAFNPAMPESVSNSRTVEVPVATATVAAWLPAKTEGARQGIAKKIVWRKYEIGNIARVEIGEEVSDGVKKAAWDAAIAGDAPRVREIIATLSPTVEGVESEEVDG